MSDLLVIGGGIIGLLTARELRLAGAEVAILEQNDAPARESSWAGGGIISPLYAWRYPDSITRLARIGHRVYPGLSQQLHEDTGIDPEYTRSGLFIHTRKEERDLALNWAREWNYRISLESGATLQQLEPARLKPPEPLLWMPEMGQVRNPRLVKALVQDLRNRGVRIHTHAPVVDFRYDKGLVREAVTPTARFPADRIILCTGAWTTRLARTLPPAPDIRPVRGQMLLFKTEPGLIRHMMLEENRYVIPRRDGRILFGSTLEESGFDKSTTAEAHQELVHLAMQRYPLLKDYPIEKHWAGLRPAAPAGIPYITRHPQIENLFVNAGHYRNGVVLAPASARLLADLVLGRETATDPTPYSLDAPRG
ncbi:glycine oxidase ThiO [Thiolapillus brandeum]|uniref:FAD dependent oxidoreductase n=1 Tax=Thiolapillus brandeum TaxID=1076588 RepID=A0A7U6GKD1_9GAMM|nr:glycine oxidase ThiO [Thiolapillus brandeum]BAO45253.1 FAD dependent oxidoreductase [Thiolapillus brandeum]